MDDSLLLEKIQKTGFELEYRTAEILRKSGWSVINNKYYIDDQQKKVREIDLVAYKTGKIDDVHIYTTLIISCKKSEAKVWAFLAKSIDIKDPNASWRPLNLWSNDKPFNFMRGQPGWEEKYFKRLKEQKVVELASIPDNHVFAYQEVSEGKASNDENIFNSVTSLMKAQAYEIDSLPKRKKTSCIYQFNLLSVVEADMREVFFNGDERKVRKLLEAHHIAAYIINNEQTFARVHFMHSSVFQKALKEYDRLHEANCAIFAEDHNEFFRDAIKDHGRIGVFDDAFNETLGFGLLFVIPNQILKGLKSSLNWNDNKQRVEIILTVGPEEIQAIKKDENAIKDVGEALRKFYRYEGDFELISRDKLLERPT